MMRGVTVAALLLSLVLSNVGADVINCTDPTCNHEISLECPGQSTCQRNCSGYASCLLSTYTCKAGTTCNLTCSGKFSCLFLKYYCEDGAVCYITCPGNGSCYGLYVNYTVAAGNPFKGFINVDVVCGPVTSCRAINFYFPTCDRCLQPVSDPDVKISQWLAVIIYYFGSVRIPVLNTAAHPDGVYQVLHPPNAMTDQVKASLSELLTRELLKNELANFTGTINVSVFITRANPQVSLVVLDPREQVVALVVASNVRTLMQQQNITQVFLADTTVNYTTTEFNYMFLTFGVNPAIPIPPALILPLITDYANNLFPKFFSAVTVVTGTILNSSFMMLNVALSGGCELPKPFWDNIICTSKTWTSIDSVVSIVYPDFVNSTSIVSSKDVVISADITIASSLLSSIYENGVSQYNISTCDSVLQGSLSIKINGEVPPEIPLFSLTNTSCKITGAFNTIDINGKNNTCFKPRKYNDGLFLITKCPDQNASVSTSIVTSVLVIGGILVFIGLGIVVYKISERQKENKFKALEKEVTYSKLENS